MKMLDMMCDSCGRPIEFQIKYTKDVAGKCNQFPGLSYSTDSVCLAITPCAHCSSPETKALELLYSAINSVKPKMQ